MSIILFNRLAVTRRRKEETHERIVNEASRALLERGYRGVGVAEVMNAAGLTHGGFYAHFESRANLLEEAADRAGADAIARLSKAAAQAEAHASLEALIDCYLDQPRKGESSVACPIVAAGSELIHQDEVVRTAATRRVKELVGLIERSMPDCDSVGSHERALSTLSCLVGAMLISRASNDERFSRSVRSAARSFLKRTLKSTSQD